MTPEQARAPKLSEPQQSLIDKLSKGARMRHEIHGRGLFRLTVDGRSRTIHPSTVTSLVGLGLLNQDMSGNVMLATSAAARAT